MPTDSTADREAFEPAFLEAIVGVKNHLPFALGTGDGADLEEEVANFAIGPVERVSDGQVVGVNLRPGTQRKVPVGFPDGSEFVEVLQHNRQPIVNNGLDLADCDAGAPTREEVGRETQLHALRGIVT